MAHELPPLFKERMQNQLGDQESISFFHSYVRDPVRSIRLNPLKPLSSFDTLQKIPWNEDGRILETIEKFITDPLWHAGAYYVQEPSSMILAAIYRQLYPDKGPERALDLCASPGGKSTLLQTMLDRNAVLIANEVIKTRAQILKENHIRFGFSENILLTRNDPRDFSKLTNFFDYIQVDAPCSGEGLFRKGEAALSEWSPANCDLCAQRQKRILAEILPALSRDGTLVYSTCTFNPEENERNMQWAARAFGLESVRLDFEKDWKIREVQDGNITGYYFYPHKTMGEGLFISVLRKKAGNPLYPLKRVPRQHFIKIKELPGLEHIITDKEHFFLTSPELLSIKQMIENDLYLLYYGLELGQEKGRDFIPSQALANFHRQLRPFPSLELNLLQALEFLRGKDPMAEAQHKGIYLVTYQGLGLGWIKHLGNRSNNYYPKGWRIRNY